MAFQCRPSDHSHVAKARTAIQSATTQGFVIIADYGSIPIFASTKRTVANPPSVPVTPLIDLREGSQPTSSSRSGMERSRTASGDFPRCPSSSARSARTISREGECPQRMPALRGRLRDRDGGRGGADRQGLGRQGTPHQFRPVVHQGRWLQRARHHIRPGRQGLCSLPIKLRPPHLVPSRQA